MSSFDAGADDLSFQPWPHWGTSDDAESQRAGAVEPELQLPTAEVLEALRQAAHDEGFAAGRAEGLSRGVGEVQAQARQLLALIGSLARPLEQLDACVEEELVALVIALVRQLVRREIKTDPGVIVAAVHEAIAVLPLSAREVVVKVHPEDALLLREVYAEPDADGGPGWRLLESPAVSRGGCVVVTSTSEVDATVERRLSAAIRHVFGGERLADAQAAGEPTAADESTSAGTGAESERVSADTREMSS